MHAKDNVATAIADIPSGTDVTINVEGVRIQIHTIQRIPFGHKIAVRRIALGENLVKYGEVIGIASKEIGVGEHVHIHNVESKRGRGDLVAQFRG